MLFTCYTNLKPESISHIEGLESDHHGESWREGARTLVRLSQEHQVNHQPTNQTGPQLTEKLQVKATNPWIQLVANEEIVQDISCRKNMLLKVWKNFHFLCMAVRYTTFTANSLSNSFKESIKCKQLLN